MLQDRNERKINQINYTEYKNITNNINYNNDIQILRKNMISYDGLTTTGMDTNVSFLFCVLYVTFIHDSLSL